MDAGGVHHKKYDGCRMKQQIKIPNVTWISSIQKKRSKCRTFFNKAFFMKDDMKVEVSNGTSKTIIPSNGVVNWDGVLKFGNMPKGDHVMHLWGWIKKLIKWNSVWKCSYAYDIIERGPMMWMWSVMDGNI